ncbi:MAG: hypothetical protein DBX55_08770 [Verrucomicrobia bacterium]|nr:MAG: hypothetical protein DBX55_08770 [Verrucomicrobiota bacterium]
MERGGRQSENPQLYWNANRSDALAVCVAAVLTILIHALIFWAVPFDIARPKEPARGDLEIAFEQPQFDRRLPDTVEANPFANDDTPASDSPESFMNQRAADEVTDPDSKSKMPYVEGEIKNGRKIVQGAGSPENAYVAAREVLETLNRPLAQPARTADSSERPAEGEKSAQAAERNARQKGAADSKNSGDSGAQTAQATAGMSGAAGESGSSADGLKNADAAAKKNAADSGGARAGLPAEPQESESVFAAVPLDSPIAPNAFSSESGGADSADSARKKSGDASKKDSQKDSSGERLSQNADESARGGARNSGEPSQTFAKTSGREPVSEPVSEPESAAEPASESEPLPKPAPRPSLSMKIPAGPLADNRVRASRQGTLAVDSRFSEFGAYQQRMIEAISRQWNLLGAQYDLVSAIGSQTVIEFRLNTRGELTRLEVLFSNSTNLGRGLCEQSILTTAPYGEWTSEMVSVLGSRDCPVRITFYYR